jgi:predicted  nucleic acid-binding Zn-ribbon protein
MIEMDWLSKQITQKSSIIIELKERTTKEIYDLESKCDDLSAENKKFKNQIDNLSKTSKEQEEQNEDLSKKLQELHDKFAKSKELYEQESIEREKLIDHYKNEITSVTSKLEEAAKMITEFQETLE